MESVNTSMKDLSNEALIDILRRCAAIWFKNSDLLLLEEFIRRYNNAIVELEDARYLEE